MSSRRNTPLTIALCASLTVHAGLVYGLIRAATSAPIWLPGSGRAEEVAASLAPIEAPRANSFDDGLRDSALGAAGGVGHAIDTSPGQSALEARKGDQDQQFLSRDPVGPGDPNNLPSMSTAPPGEALRQALASGPPSDAAATATPAPLFGVVESQDAAQRLAPAPREQLDDGKELSAKRQASEVPGPQNQAEHASAMTTASLNSPPAVTPAPAQPAPSAPSAQQSASAANAQPADPAPMSESESDPFSVEGSARFRPGKTDVQLGRKHRLVRPRFDLASMAGAMQLQRPVTVGLKLWLDENGNITRVVIARSSGSPEVDQPVKVAAYEWWLEPTKDPKTGKPIQDVIGFLVRLE